MGKGDTYRPVNQKKYEENWLRLYGVKCPVCDGSGEEKRRCLRRPIKCGICLGHGLVEPRIAEKYNVESY